MTYPLDYKQTDPHWKNIDYSAKGESTTIGGSGCGPTAVADIIAAWKDPTVTPRTECAWALKHSYKAPHQGTYYGYVSDALDRYGIKSKRLTSSSIYGQPNHNAIKTALKELAAGNCVLVACMGKGLWTSSGHFVTPYKVDTAKGIIYIRDPASSRAARLQGDLNTWRKQVKQLWVVYYPGTNTKPKKEDPDMTEKETKALITEALKDYEKAPTYFETVEAVPYGRDTIEKLTEKGVLKGTGKGLHLTETMLRMLVIMDRLGMI